MEQGAEGEGGEGQGAKRRCIREVPPPPESSPPPSSRMASIMCMMMADTESLYHGKFTEMVEQRNDSIGGRGLFKPMVHFTVADAFRIGHTRTMIPHLVIADSALPSACFTWVQMALDHGDPDVAMYLYKHCISGTRTPTDNFRMRRLLTEDSSRPFFSAKHVQRWMASIRSLAHDYCFFLHGDLPPSPPELTTLTDAECIQRFVYGHESMEKFLAMKPQEDPTAEEARQNVRLWVYNLNSQLSRSEGFWVELLHHSLRHCHTCSDVQALTRVARYFQWNFSVDPRLVEDMHRLFIDCITRDDYDMFCFMELHVLPLFEESGTPFQWSDIAHLEISPWFKNRDESMFLRRLQGTYNMMHGMTGEEISYMDYAQCLRHKETTSRLYSRVVNNCCPPDATVSLLGYQIRYMTGAWEFGTFMESIPATKWNSYTNILLWHHALADKVFAECNLDLFRPLYERGAFHGWNLVNNQRWMFGKVFAQPEMYRFVRYVRGMQVAQPVDRPVLVPAPVPRLQRSGGGGVGGIGLERSSSSSSDLDDDEEDEGEDSDDEDDELDLDVGMGMGMGGAVGDGVGRLLVVRISTIGVDLALHDAADKEFGGSRMIQRATFDTILREVHRSDLDSFASRLQVFAKSAIGTPAWKEIRTVIQARMRQSTTGLPLLFPCQLKTLTKKPTPISVDMICSYIFVQHATIRQVTDEDERSMIMTHEVQPTLALMFSTFCSALFQQFYEEWYGNAGDRPFCANDVASFLPVLFSGTGYHPLIAKYLTTTYSIAYFTTAFLAIMVRDYAVLTTVLSYQVKRPDLHKPDMLHIYWDLIAVAFETGQPDAVHLLLNFYFIQDGKVVVYPRGPLYWMLSRRCHTQYMSSLLAEWYTLGVKTEGSIGLSHTDELGTRDPNSISIIWPEVVVSSPTPASAASAASATATPASATPAAASATATPTFFGLE